MATRYCNSIYTCIKIFCFTRIDDYWLKKMSTHCLCELDWKLQYRENFKKILHYLKLVINCPFHFTAAEQTFHFQITHFTFWELKNISLRYEFSCKQKLLTTIQVRIDSRCAFQENNNERFLGRPISKIHKNKSDIYIYTHIRNYLYILYPEFLTARSTTGQNQNRVSNY